MKKIILFFSLMAFASLAISCQVEEDDYTATSTILNTTLIAKAGCCLNMPSQNTVIRTAAEWNTFIYTNTTNPHPVLLQANIDFNTEMVIAAVDIGYGTQGRTIDIMSVTENPFDIVVDIDRTYNGDVTAMPSQPFHIVKVQKSVKPVIFT